MIETTATGTVGGHQVEFIPTHREGNTTPITMQMSMTLPISVDDVVAALWGLVTSGMDLDELDDAEYTHSLVVETFLHEGGDRITNVRWKLEKGTLDPEQTALLEKLRARVVELYGQQVPPPRRAAVGVSA